MKLKNNQDNYHICIGIQLCKSFLGWVVGGGGGGGGGERGGGGWWGGVVPNNKTKIDD